MTSPDATSIREPLPRAAAGEEGEPSSGLPLVATFIAKPGRLSEDLVEGFRAVWAREGRAAPMRWLSPGEAAEVEFADQLKDRSQAERAADARGVDLCIQASANRRKRLLVADMDSTMIGQECIDELAAEAGVGGLVAGITERAMNGEIDFPTALRERVALLRGLPVATIDKVLATRITLMPGGRELLATMRAEGAHTLLVSGGFLSFAEPVARLLGFHEARANTLLAHDGLLTGAVAEPILGRDAKAEALLRTCEALGILPGEVLAVGDGANDLGMLALAGTGVAFRAKPAVQERCALRVNHGDLTALLFLQGLRRDEFRG